MFKTGSYGYIAEKNLISLEKNKVIEDYDTMIFLCEQCIEKLLKHYLTLTYIEEDRDSLMRSHKLYRLAMKSGISELKSYYQILTELGNLYFDSRYPGIDYEDVSKERALELYDATLAIYKIIKDKIVLASNAMESQKMKVNFNSKNSSVESRGMDLFGKGKK